MGESSPPKHRTLRSPLVIHFEGPGAARQRLSLRDLVAFGTQVQIALDRVALRLQSGTDSIRMGRRVGEIAGPCALDVVSVEGGGSVTLICDLPPQAQQHLGEFKDPAETALRSLVEGLSNVSRDDERLPPGYDTGVLVALRDAGKILERAQLERVSFRIGHEKRAVTSELTGDTYEHIIRRIQKPTRNRRTMEGRLLMADFRETDLRCRVHPPLGPPVECEFDETQRETVLSAMTHFVRVIGESVEVEGAVRRLRIQDIELLDTPQAFGIPGLDTARIERGSPSLQELASASPLKPMADVLSQAAGIWPEADEIDDFLRSVRRWRKEGRAEPVA